MARTPDFLDGLLGAVAGLGRDHAEDCECPLCLAASCAGAAQVGRHLGDQLGAHVGATVTRALAGPTRARRKVRAEASAARPPAPRLPAAVPAPTGTTWATVDGRRVRVVVTPPAPRGGTTRSR